MSYKSNRSWTLPNFKVGVGVGISECPEYSLQFEVSVHVVYDTWEPGEYSIGDKVTYNDENWECLIDIFGPPETHIEPTEGVFWKKIE